MPGRQKVFSDWVTRIEKIRDALIDQGNEGLYLGNLREISRLNEAIEAAEESIRIALGEDAKIFGF